MMFVNRYVGCIKVDGKILREDSGVVTLPFGAEFSILLKNLNSLRATAKVSVDGTDATEGTSLVIPANGSLELERFIRNGNLAAGNRFKFIERTAGIEAHKGIGAEDGLVRIEFHSEVQPAIHQTVITHHQHYDHWHRWRYWPYDPWTLGGGTTYGMNANTVQTSNINSASLTSSSNAAPRPRFSASAGKGPAAKGSPLRMRTMKLAAGKGSPRSIVRSAALNDAGITVAGSESSQRFSQGAWFQTETVGHVIVLQLRGAVGGKVVLKPVTVKSKPTCGTCGKTNKPLDKFCGECGASLTVI
jgi:hypothetical protein